MPFICEIFVRFKWYWYLYLVDGGLNVDYHIQIEAFCIDLLILLSIVFKKLFLQALYLDYDILRHLGYLTGDMRHLMMDDYGLYKSFEAFNIFMELDLKFFSKSMDLFLHSFCDILLK